jgi:large subunit ribosomal protein L4
MAEKEPKTPRAAKPQPKPKAKAQVKTGPAPVVKAAAGTAPTLPVVGVGNQSLGTVTLSADVFGGRVNTHLIYEAVKQYRAGGRAGTHMTKNRALVSGSGRKPWRQKGTGRARVGEVRNPLWRHGGTVFGPVPRDYSYSMPKKARIAALRSAFSQRIKDGAVKVVDAFPIEVPAEKPYRLTKQLATLLTKLGVVGKTTIVAHEPSAALVLSGRNNPAVRVVPATHVTVYDVLDCQNVLVQREALVKLEERLLP